MAKVEEEDGDYGEEEDQEDEEEDGFVEDAEGDWGGHFGCLDWQIG